jgi:hypothetical protein
MLRDNLVELIAPMLNSAGADPLALGIHNQTQASDDRLPCLETPRPAGAESSLTGSASSPFQVEPAHYDDQLEPVHNEFACEARFGPRIYWVNKQACWGRRRSNCSASTR